MIFTRLKIPVIKLFQKTTNPDQYCQHQLSQLTVYQPEIPMIESQPILAFFNLTAYEITAIVFIVLLLFGANKLPELARGTGKAIREFKKASSEAESTLKEALKEDHQNDDLTTSKTPEGTSKQ